MPLFRSKYRKSNNEYSDYNISFIRENYFIFKIEIITDYFFVIFKLIKEGKYY